MNPLTLISFVRHGHVHNPGAVYYGRSPRFRLSDQGVVQAQAAAQVLQNQEVAVIFSSPMLRARQTALIIQAAHPAVPVRISQLLNEVHTPFDGHPITDLVARQWDLYSDVPPEYEQPLPILKRVQKFITRVRRSYWGRHSIAVTHGDLIAFSILWAKAIPVNAESKQEFRRLGLSDSYPATGSITTLAFQTADPAELPGVEYLNRQPQE